MPRTRTLHEVQLGLLDLLIEVCAVEGISWALMYGSLLGAVRSGGLIPGDDDIDVAMPRADFDRFREVGPRLLGSKAFLQDAESDPWYYSGGVLRLRDPASSFVEAVHLHQGHHAGVCLDIVAIDGVPMDRGLARRHVEDIRALHRLIFAFRYKSFRSGFLDMDAYEWGKVVKQAHAVNERDVLSELECLYHRYDASSTGRAAVLTQYTGRYEFLSHAASHFERWESAWFDRRRVPVPSRPRTLLAEVYGAGYGTPATQVDAARALWVDPSCGYEEALAMLREPLAGLEGRRVIVFGAAAQWEMFRSHAPGVHVDTLVDSDPSLWGQLRGGLRVHSPNVIAHGDVERTTVIICSQATHAVKDQARGFGIDDVRPSPWVIDPDAPPHSATYPGL